MDYHEEGAYAWLVDEKEVFIPVRVTKAFHKGETGQVVKVQPKVNTSGAALLPSLEEEQQAPIDYQNRYLFTSSSAMELSGTATKSLLRADGKSLLPTSDMVDMIELSEPSLLYNLRLRFLEKRVYTSIGNILVSVNPFQVLALFTPDVLEKYKQAGTPSERQKLGPHVYGIAHNAYNDMISNRANQSCIVTGESGSGKTEFAKLFLQFAMEISRSHLTTTTTTVEDNNNMMMDEASLLSLSTKILTTNAVLEAFGNAKTMRNDNSSRFGKWLQLSFHKQRGDVLGCTLQVYLLEKSRLVHQSSLQGERNYHIFYQLLGCGDATLLDSLQLTTGVDSFAYLSNVREDNASYVQQQQGNVVNDSRAWAETVRSLRILGMTPEHEGKIFKTLAGLLHLGNVVFEPGKVENSSVVANPDVLEVAAELLELSNLTKSLTFKDLSNTKEKIHQNRSPLQAKEARDALAKFLYAKLFDWIVSVINSTLGSQEGGSSSKDALQIGILDVFGFEVFERNSFNQFCINYCNEKLQVYFQQQVYEMEKKEYLRQGVPDVDALFELRSVNNVPMFEDRPNGFFPTLEDEILLPKSSDFQFLARFTKLASRTYPCFANSSSANEYKFVIKHYSGNVTYEAMGFLEQSKDRIDPGLEKLAMLSPGLAGMISSQNTATHANGPRKPIQKTLGTKFVSELNDLIESLQAVQPHFARCIKPNDKKSPNEFQAPLVMHQLRCAGLLDVCRVRQGGFPIRFMFDDFVWRYMCLAARGKTVQEMFRFLVKDSTAGFLGKTKVLLKNSAFGVLETKREISLRSRVILIQKVVRGWRMRKQWFVLRDTMALLGRTLAKPTVDLDLVDTLLDQLPTEFLANHPIILKANFVKQQQDKRAIVLDMIARVKNPKEAELVKLEAFSIGMSFEDPALVKINELLKRPKNAPITKQIKVQMQNAMDTRDLSRLDQVLEAAKGFTSEAILADAVMLRDRLIREQNAVLEVERIMGANTENAEELRAAVRNMVQLGMDSHPVAREGIALLKKWKQTYDGAQDQVLRATPKQSAEVVTRLHAAEKKQLWGEFQTVYKTALELGMEQHPEILRAARKIRELGEDNSLQSSLGIVTDLLVAKANLKSGTGLTVQDVERLVEVISVSQQRGSTDPDLARALIIVEKCQAQLRIQLNLEDGLAKKDINKLKSHLFEASKAHIDNELVRRARAVVSKETGGQTQTPQARRQSRAVEMSKLTEGDYEKRRMERLLEARHPRNDWWNLEEKGVIRTNEDFAGWRGIVDRKKAAQAKTKLVCTGQIIPKSITILKDDRLAARAILLNKALLGFCGDIVLPFPAILVQQMLEASLRDLPLADELYVQLLRQLTQNPSYDSEHKAWILLCICASCLGPSCKDVENAVLHFLLFQSTNSAELLHKELAKFALRKFEHVVLLGPSGVIPTQEEIVAFQERPPSLVTINLPDGTELTRDVPVNPDTIVSELVDTCCETYGLLPQSAHLFGLYVLVDPVRLADKRTTKLRRNDVALSIDSTLARASFLPLSPTAGGGKFAPRPPSIAPPASRRPSLMTKMRLTWGKSPPTQTLLEEADTEPTVFEQQQQQPTPTTSAQRRRSSTLLQKLGLRSSRIKSSLSPDADPRESGAELSVFEEEQTTSMPAPRSSFFGGGGRKSQRSTSAYVVEPAKARLHPQAKQMPEKVPEPLTPKEFLGDILAQHVAAMQRDGVVAQPLVYVFRRKIMYELDKEPVSVKDKGAYVSLCFIEAMEEFFDDLWGLPTKEHAALFACLVITEIRKGKAPLNLPAAFAEYVKEFLPPKWRNDPSIRSAEWLKLVCAQAAKLKVTSGKETRRLFLQEMARYCPNFGQITFPVRYEDQMCLFGCDYKGVYIWDRQEYVRLVFVEHKRIKKLAAFPSNCTILCWNEKMTSTKENLVLVTKQGHTIVAMLWEFAML